MKASSSTAPSIRIGHYEVKPAHNQLIKNDEVIELEPLAMAMLLLLAEEPGRVVGSDELFEKLWQGKVVTDNALHRIVRQLRKAFDDKADNPQYIRTVRKSGYVLISSVETNDAPIKQISNTLKTALATAMVALSGITFYLVNSAPVSYRMLPATQLTSLPGIEMDPILWTRGNSVIFTHQPPGELYNNVVVRPLDASQYDYWTDDYLHYANLSLSQDGRYLAFVLRDVHSCTINYADITAGEYNRIELAKCRFEADFKLAWSTDGRQLYYNKSGKKRGNSQLVAINIQDKSSRALLTASPDKHNDYLPSVEPGGQRVAFIRFHSGEAQVRLFNPQTQADDLLITWDTGNPLQALSWLGDEQALLLNSKNGLFMLTLDGHLSNIDAPLSSDYAQMVINSNGTMIYSQNSQTTLLEEITLPGPNNPAIKEHFKGQPIAQSSKSEYNGYYGADNQSIVFLSDRESNDYRLWLYQNDEARLLYDKPVGSPARWSKDNSQLVFVTQDRRIATLVIDSGKVSEFENPTSVNKVTWGHHNKLIYFSQTVDEQQQLFQLDLLSKQVTQLTQDGGYTMQPSDDGQYLYYNKYNQTGLWRLDLANNSHHLLLPDFNRMNYAGWQAFNNGLYYIRDAKAKRGLFFYDFASGLQRQLIDNKEFYRFDVSPDQRKVLLSEKKALVGDLYMGQLERR